MKKIATFILLLFPLVASAQSAPDSVVVDTLDWHRYYPLEVGNVWEYEVSEGEPLLVHSIVDEIITPEHHYFVQEVTSWDFDYLGGGTELEIFHHDTLYVRYSDHGSIFEFSDIDADTVSYSNNNLAIYDLRSAFGDTVNIPQNPDDYYVVSGGFEDSVEVSGFWYVPAASKHFTSFAWYQSYAIDIGLLSSRNLWGPTLTYAKVGGTEYGFSRIPTSIEVESVSPNGLTIEAYPNPVSDKLHVTIRSSHVTSGSIIVSNLLGQTISHSPLPTISYGSQSFLVAADSWPSGIYFLRLFSDENVQVVRSFVKAK